MDEDSSTHDRLGMEVGRYMEVFYADHGMIGLRDPEWLQGAINVFIRLLIRVSMMSNAEKSNTMTCQSGAIYTGMSETDISRGIIG